MRRLLLVLATAAACCGAPEGSVRSFFKSHCVKCHGPDKQKGDLRLDTVAMPTAVGDAGDLWTLIVEQIESGDMPPKKEPRIPAARKDAFLALASDAMAKSAQPMPALRRLNRTEYQYTVRDLFGTDVTVRDMLPEDGSVQGFDNVAGGLSISAVLMQRYLEAADAAFESTIRRIQPLEPATRRAVLMENKNNLDSVEKNKGGVIESHGAFVDFTPGWPPARVDEAHPIEDGVYRCRVAVWPHDPGDRTLSLAIFVGPLFGTGKRNFIGNFDVTGTPDNPGIIEFEAFFETGHAIQLLARISPEHVTWRDKHEKRPGIAIKWAETHGPLDQQWPAPSQQALFGDHLIKEGNPVWMRHRKNVKDHYVDSDAPAADAERVIRTFVPRAFRRPVEKALVDEFVALAHDRLAAGRSYEEAVRAAVTATLCSPHFLVLNQGAVDDYAIASRLSYFIWRSMPDDELLAAAAAGKLRSPQNRRQQLERLLKDPKAERFVEDFTDQWLDLRDIEFTTPDPKLHPEYDDLLRDSMVAETRHFFRHVLHHNLSLMTFVDSDFAILNERLARHYGIDGVKGHEKLQLVKLPEDSIRGGILAHASVLKVTANGTNSSPVLRGLWVLDHLLAQPAPPPPAGVPAVEPDIRGATTIREQLAKHRDQESCARCHNRIDPPGFALEEFDVIGGHRDRYRTLGPGDKVPVYKSFRLAKAVEPHGETTSGTAFAGFREFRQLLTQDSDAIATGMAKKLMVYGTGRPVTPADRAQVEAIVAEAKKHDLSFRAMLHAVVNSDFFLRP